VCRYSPKKAKGFGMLQVDNDLKKIAKQGLFFQLPRCRNLMMFTRIHLSITA